MSKLAARIYDWWSSDKTAKRYYSAGRLNRQNADWVTRPTSENWEQRQSLQVLRARARFAAKNDPYLSRYLDLTRANVIGQKGLQLQSRAMKADETLDTKINKYVEEQWWQWSHAETCTISGKLDWKGIQDLVATLLECDGESLIQMIAADNDFAFSLKVWNVDYLSEYYNTLNPATGNRIIMSVEVDRFDRPVAYHLTVPPSDRQFVDRRNVEFFRQYAVRVPAEQMIHIGNPKTRSDEAQVRSVTGFAPVLLTAKNYQSYLQGVIQSARFTSNIPLFIKQLIPDGSDGPGWTGPETAEGRPILPEMDVSPLAVNLLDPGQEPWQLDPKQPTQNHAAFAKTILMELGAGLGVPYFLLANDWEATNFSSSRGGLDAARDMWRERQQFIATTLCRRVFHTWARTAFLNGRLQMTARQFVEIQNPAWKGRGWKYIDPVKDINAAVTGLENDLTTWPAELAEQGIDFIDHLHEIKAQEDQAMKILGRKLVAVTTVKVADAGTAPPEEEGDPAPTPDKKAPPPKRELSNGHELEIIS